MTWFASIKIHKANEHKINTSQIYIDLTINHNPASGDIKDILIKIFKKLMSVYSRT